MKNLAKVFSLLGLLLTIVPPVLFFMGSMEMGTMKIAMGIGMVAWIASAPFWINKPAGSDQG
ncbi:hypothetical protein DFQ04_2999 [Algoriphagus boseongensis]|uniref:Uncharacterized protein n=1 Tax=Algoriphagus boseongensis TaxID=1442587 RepID=A0A4R6T351_9BACT|nr:hypothetical protein [Algoriphagus boseongensis]TDQ15113.1 hypothetical protein DFQ04_2999 [Algoriphagus boseongensis]